MRKHVIVIVIVIIIPAVLLIGYRLVHDNRVRDIKISNTGSHYEVQKNLQQSILQIPEPVEGTVGSELDYVALGKLIQKSVEDGKPWKTTDEITMGVTSHHLPTASPLIGQFYRTLKDSKGPRKVFVVVGPDHYEKCTSTVTTTKRAYRTSFGELASGAMIVDELTTAGVVVDDECFSGEHAIAVESNYIKYLYKDAVIVPVLFSIKSAADEIAKVQQVLDKHPEVFLLVSVDFNHYQALSIANISDEKAASAILSLNDKAIVQDMLDSPPSMKLAINLARRRKLISNIIRRANSYEFTGLPENTTSYMNVVFVRKQ